MLQDGVRQENSYDPCVSGFSRIGGCVTARRPPLSYHQLLHKRLALAMKCFILSLDGGGTSSSCPLDPRPGACCVPRVPARRQAFVPAVMDKTLEENGIVDDDMELERLGLDEDGFTPVIHIYFNDDLTIA